jgi:hypothetical protein
MNRIASPFGFGICEQEIAHSSQVGLDTPRSLTPGLQVVFDTPRGLTPGLRHPRSTPLV